jgi:hypothetical protein
MTEELTGSKSALNIKPPVQSKINALELALTTLMFKFEHLHAHPA